MVGTKMMLGNFNVSLAKYRANPIPLSENFNHGDETLEFINNQVIFEILYMKIKSQHGHGVTVKVEVRKSILSLYRKVIYAL